MDYDFPYHVDGRGRSAEADYNHHVRDLIEQVLFTTPGERVNRPTFGSGVMQILFAPLSNELAAATKFQVQGALQQWLGDVIQLEGLDLKVEDSTLIVHVRYIVRKTQTRQVAEFSKEV
jgi:phage baseplate assembly protein W